MFSQKWIEHYEQVSMTRTEHFLHAWSKIPILIKMTVTLIIHSFAPRFFTTYYSDKLKELNEEQWKNAWIVGALIENEIRCSVAVSATIFGEWLENHNEN